jgi:hypothetical protein
MSPVVDSTLHSLPLYNFRSRTVPRFLILIPVPNEPSHKFNFSVGVPLTGLAKYERSPLGSSQGHVSCFLLQFRFTYES